MSHFGFLSVLFPPRSLLQSQVAKKRNNVKINLKQTSDGVNCYCCVLPSLLLHIKDAYLFKEPIKFLSIAALPYQQKNCKELALCPFVKITITYFLCILKINIILQCK